MGGGSAAMTTAQSTERGLPMTKLTDTQLIVLSAAAQQHGGAALPLPKSVKLRGSAVNHVLQSLLKRGLLDEQPASHDAAPWRESKDGQRLTLVISDAGRQAIRIDTDQATKQPSGPRETATKHQPRANRQAANQKPKPKAERPAPRAGTKQSVLVELLSRRDGATIAEAVRAIGWQSHSVRGAISGIIKKRFGLAVTSAKAESRGRVYRISRKH
jgi:hypothetical protein